MYRRGISSRTRKLVIGGAAAALLGGALAVSTGLGQAAESCVGLDQALQNNLNFIAGQRANPDALADARIANRQAVVDLIQSRRATAGCTADIEADGAAGGAAGAGQGNAGAGNQGQGQGQGQQQGNQGNQGAGNNGGGAQAGGNGNAGNQGNQGGGDGEVVCNGSTVTLSGEGGAPAASSGTFPVGTQLRVTNLDNNKSTTVEVTGASGSCALLNNAAFEQVREPGKFLIRRAVIERVG